MKDARKVVLITGASSGIGRAAAGLLLVRGYRVYAGARRTERMAELAARGAAVLRLDVTDDGSMRAAVEAVIAAEGRLDALVNNAGYGAHGAAEDVPIAEAKRQFDVNVFGLARMTQLALPHMRARGRGRIVNISSIAGKMTTPAGAWYHASKHAVEAYSDALRLEVGQFGIKVVLVEPGPIRTEWDDTALVNLKKFSGSGPYAPLVRRLTDSFRVAYRRGAPGPEAAAKVILKALEAPRPSARYAVPFSAAVLIFLKRLTPDCVLDLVMRKALGL